MNDPLNNVEGLAVNANKNEEKKVDYVVYLSVPRTERTQEQILFTISKMKSIIAAMLFPKFVKFIYIENFSEYSSELLGKDFKFKDKKEQQLWYLSESISFVSDADIVVQPTNCWRFRECDIIATTVRAYDVNIIDLDYRFVCPDIYEKDKARCTENVDECRGSIEPSLYNE